VAERLGANDSQNCIHNIGCSSGVASVEFLSPRLKRLTLQTSGIHREFPWLYVVIEENNGEQILAIGDHQEMSNTSTLAYPATCIQISTIHRPDTS